MYAKECYSNIKPCAAPIQVAIETCAMAAGSLHEVHFVLFEAEIYDAFILAAEKLCV